MLRDARISEELATIAAANGGMLRPAQVVEFARDEATALHSKFDWDDSEAARKWRIEQARAVIRVNVTVISDACSPVRAFVSLTSDRVPGGGYRAMVDVLANDLLSQQMVNDALADFQVLRAKYERLRELRPVWDALDKVGNSADRSKASAAG